MQQSQIGARSWFAALTLTCIVAFVIGCGGGGSSSPQPGPTPSPTPTPTPVPTPTPAPTTRLKLTIDWAARTRNVAGPAAALSAVVTLSNSDPVSGGPVTLPPINRRSDPAAYREEYTLPTEGQVRVGPTGLSIVFHAGENGQGAVVADATVPVNIQPDGTGVGSVTLNQRVTTLEVAEGQSLLVGESKQLTFIACGSDGIPVGLVPGAVTFVLVEGEDDLTVTPDGVATGRGYGPARVKAAMDGLESAPTLVKVTVASITIAPNPFVIVGETKALSVLGKDANGGDVPLTGNAVAYTVVSGNDLVEPVRGGRVKGLKTGVARVKALVDGKESPEIDLPVFYNDIVLADATVAVGETIIPSVIGRGIGVEAPIPADQVSLDIVSGGDSIALVSPFRVTGIGIGTARIRATAFGNTLVQRNSEEATLTVTIGPEVATGSGLKYREMRLGTGTLASPGRRATVNYRLFLPNGTRLQSSFPSDGGPGPFTFTVGSRQVIRGFDEGVSTMKQGGERKLFLPSELAYGPTPPPGSGIPANSDLIFDVQLVRVE